MLSIATVEAQARILLNEEIASFWTSANMTAWCALCATDISCRTLCVENTEDISLITGTRIYSPVTSYLKIQNVLYTNIFTSLKRISNVMQGVQSAIVSGPPEYYFDFAGKLWVSPAPSAAESAHVLTLMLATETSDITKIPSRYLLSAALFVAAVGFAKERQNGRAAQIFSWYISTLQSDVQNIITPKLIPPALDAYNLRQTTEVAQPAAGANG